MGYGYGVWIVLPVDWISTHIPHITIACNMKREDAFLLYQEFVELNGRYVQCSLDLSDYKILGPDYYTMDSSDASWSWGYRAEVCANIPTNIDRSYLPSDHHISMQYEDLEKDLAPVKKDSLCSLNCVVEVADITSDTPSDWKIITELGKY